MPGRKPADAVRAYIEPIQQAFSCLQGVAKVNHANRVRNVGDIGAWILNADGMTLPGFGHLQAQQKYELVHTSEAHFADTGERYRVSTRGYLYEVRREVDDTQIAWHWHPDGTSSVVRPHIHPSFDRKIHLVGPRAVIEDIIENCIAMGAEPACDDWATKLAETGGVHKLYRSWSSSPDEPHG